MLKINSTMSVTVVYVTMCISLYMHPPYVSDIKMGQLLNKPMICFCFTS